MPTTAYSKVESERRLLYSAALPQFFFIQFRVRVNGVDVFEPQTGEMISDHADSIAGWFIDTANNEESFLVRHAFFLG